jgi:hypothetical protein
MTVRKEATMKDAIIADKLLEQARDELKRTGCLKPKVLLFAVEGDRVRVTEIPTGIDRGVDLADVHRYLAMFIQASGADAAALLSDTWLKELAREAIVFAAMVANGRTGSVQLRYDRDADGLRIFDPEPVRIGHSALAVVEINGDGDDENS